MMPSRSHLHHELVWSHAHAHQDNKVVGYTNVVRDSFGICEAPPGVRSQARCCMRMAEAGVSPIWMGNTLDLGVK